MLFRSIRGDVAYDKDDNVVEYNISEANALVAANAYKDKRAAEYPPLTELADALYHQQNGDDSKMTAYLAKVDAVKQKYPKE